MSKRPDVILRNKSKKQKMAVSVFHTGLKHTKEAKEKIKLSLIGFKDELSRNWKGDDVGYWGLHKWVQRKLGKPKVCEHCDATYKERKLVWANKDHTYKRNLKDWISLCYSCHKKYDLENN